MSSFQRDMGKDLLAGAIAAVVAIPQVLEHWSMARADGIVALDGDDDIV